MFHCYHEKARLVSILSQSEQEFVNSMVRLSNPTTYSTAELCSVV